VETISENTNFNRNAKRLQKCSLFYFRMTRSELLTFISQNLSQNLLFFLSRNQLIFLDIERSWEYNVLVKDDG